MTGALPRFTGPLLARKRLRLITAIGILAVTSVVTGALASLGERGPTLAHAPARPPQPRATEPVTPERRDPAALVEARVLEAEDAAVRAWAAVRSARQLGFIDPQLLDEYERRLDLLGGGASSASPVEQRSQQPPPSGRQPRLSIDGSPRGL